MALTLVEAAKLEKGNTVRQAIIQLYAESHGLLAALPFIDIPGGAYTYNQEETLPGIAFRGVNEAYAEGTGIINPLVERLVIAGGDLDVDKAIQKMNGAGQRALHTAMKVKSLAHTIAHKMIKGDSSVSVKEFDGLQKRITGNQLISAGTTNGGDPGKIDLFRATKDQVENPTHWLMSRAMRRKLTAASHDTTVGGYITFGEDGLGRRVTQFDDLPIIAMDENTHANATLAFNEVGSTGATATATSVYCVSLSDGHMQGIQNGGMDVRDLGELQEKPADRTRVEWLMAMVLHSPYSAARYYGISDAPLVK